jgi:hypothetical protein
MAILKQQPGNIKHAQAATYLGPILEDAAIFDWNGKRQGTQWKLIINPPMINELKELISRN